MTKKEIAKHQARINKIWGELEPLITGTGASSLIEELVDLECELTLQEGQ